MSTKLEQEMFTFNTKSFSLLLTTLSHHQSLNYIWSLYFLTEFLLEPFLSFLIPRYFVQLINALTTPEKVKPKTLNSLRCILAALMLKYRPNIHIFDPPASSA